MRVALAPAHSLLASSKPACRRMATNASKSPCTSPMATIREDPAARSWANPGIPIVTASERTKANINILFIEQVVLSSLKGLKAELQAGVILPSGVTRHKNSFEILRLFYIIHNGIRFTGMPAWGGMSARTNCYLYRSPDWSRDREGAVSSWHCHRRWCDSATFQRSKRKNSRR